MLIASHMDRVKWCDLYLICNAVNLKFKFTVQNVFSFRGLVFEKAYSQYRLNQPQEALKTVNASSNLSLKLKELKAQILYRLER